MKFNPLEWQEITVGKEIDFGKGRLRLQCSQASPLYVSLKGQEALAGVGDAFDLTFSQAVSVRLDAAKPVRAFVRIEQETAVEPSGETFTNTDRMVDESGSVAEVTKALRQFKLEQRAVLLEVRAERAAFRAEQEHAVQPVDQSESVGEVKADDELVKT